MNEPVPMNQETDPRYNREPGIVLVPGSNYMREVSKFEQFPTKYTAMDIPGCGPGNAYQKREFPKMLYRAERFHGSPACMAAPPDPYAFSNDRDLKRAMDEAQAFNLKCQLIVQDETQMERAYKDGWRQHPAEAVKALIEGGKNVVQATAERNYEDRGMSDLAKREIVAAEQEADGEPVPEVKRKPVRRTKKIRTA